MDMQRIIGLVFSGFAVKAYAIGAAVWIAFDVVAPALETIGNVL